MAVTGWVLDKSAAARAADLTVGKQLAALAGQLHVCQVGQLEQLYSSRSANDYDTLAAALHSDMLPAAAPADLLDRALTLQRDLAHHHGMWHRTAIPDLLIAETALHNDLGILHVDRDYERISEVRPLITRRLG
ncbi:PIN domain-containing protein [soil metagenome]